MNCSTPVFPILHYLTEFVQTHVYWVSDAIQLSYYLLPLLLLLSIFPSIQVFSNESALCIRWPKYWSFSFSINTSNEYSGLISFRIDWFDLLAVQETLKSLLQHHSLNASIFWHSASLWSNFHICSWLLGKTIALSRQTFVGKVMSLLFNTLARFVISFLQPIFSITINGI